MEQYNKVWWIEDKKPIIYNGMICIPTGITQLTNEIYKLWLFSEGYNNNAQFTIDTNLHNIELKQG